MSLLGRRAMSTKHGLVQIGKCVENAWIDKAILDRNRNLLQKEQSIQEPKSKFHRKKDWKKE